MLHVLPVTTHTHDRLKSNAKTMKTMEEHRRVSHTRTKKIGKMSWTARATTKAPQYGPVGGVFAMTPLEPQNPLLQTKATVGGVPPFSLVCLSHSRELLCTLRMKMV